MGNGACMTRLMALGNGLPVYVAIIIGAMKAGTTSLYNYLQTHPEICPAVIKEPEFFSENQHYHGIRKQGIRADQYADLWAFDASVHKYALEASTGYTQFPKEPGVPKKIFDYGLRPKFIYLLRDPFDRVLSQRNFLKNKPHFSAITEAEMISISNYFLQLEQYRRYFPAEDFLLLDFDTLKNDPLAVLRSVYGFLGLSEAHLPTDLDVHNPTRLESKFEKRLRASPLKTAFHRLPGPLKQFGKGLLEMLPSDRGSLGDPERQAVYAQLEPDMARLHDVYGVDVRKWGFGAK